MRTLTMFLSAIILTLISTQVTAMETKEGKRQSCKIVTGYGTAVGYGATKNQAREEARLNCGSHMIDSYFAQRQQIPEDKKDDLALACVNLDCQ